ncbi:MAG: hypothetical protein B6U94_03975 [Thermofilum sp. ex4484_79]|nr:MAG: hypothetical protein B6U94_03975 [Thermofilum sp. ex4484_79]
MYKKIAEIRLGPKDGVLIAALAIIILTATLFQYSLMNFPRASGFELELILLTVLFLSIAILHEIIHYTCT